MKRRGLEIAVLLFGGAFLVAVILSFRPGSRPRRGARPGEDVPPSRREGQAMTVSSGFDFTETVRGKPLFRIRAARTVAFGEGATQALTANLYSGEDVTLTVYPEQGAPVTVHADRAEYDPRTRAARLEGNVRWTDGAGSIGETRRLAFDPASRRLDAPEAVHLSRGAFDLQARSGGYDLGTRVLHLGGPLTGSGSGEGTAGLSELSADRAEYRRDEGVVELQGKVSAASKTGDRIDADSLTLKLAADEKRLLWARAQGNVNGVIGPRPVASAPPTRRDYSAREAALFLGEAGDVRSLTLSGSPAVVSEPQRRLSGESIEMLFANGRALSARVRGHVSIDAGPDHSQADRADAAFGPDGSVSSLELAGDARLTGPERAARADKAVRVPARGVWILTSAPGGSAAVESAGSRVSAARIEIDESKKTLRAEGDTRALLAPGKSRGPTATLIADPSRPTRGKAEKMAFDDSARVAILSGKAALWQDASTLFADNITLNDTERTVVASGSARAVVAPNPSSARPEERRPSTLTGGRLIYREKENVADLDGGVTAARGPWKATGERGTAKFGPARKVERVELWGNVRVTDAAAGRTGQADHAVDLPAEGKTVLEGSPARVSDREGNQVAGASLTITGRGGRVEVTAPLGGRTETIHKTRPD